ncbi:CoA pyrophosphatase [Oceanibium sediminis]|uniref:CoA pyrophosphatase n=1 Tax=Oceanibium sediminis TaxID=2026339 RepID=UPI00280BCCDD|nr:CoA pyrophosphatase [Oceanibium sediminis]
MDTLSRALAAPGLEKSSDYDLNPEIWAGLPPVRKLKPAAVLVPLLQRDSGLQVVLTRRSRRLKHHPGQIAFPGGRVDPDDATRWDAALREAEEEIALPRDVVSPLGVLNRHETVTGFDVEPHIGLIEGPADFHPAEAEVAEVFEVPLWFLLDPAHYQTHTRRWNGIDRRYYAVPWGPYYIWGATARMLKGLSDRVSGA